MPLLENEDIMNNGCHFRKKLNEKNYSYYDFISLQSKFFYY